MAEKRKIVESCVESLLEDLARVLAYRQFSRYVIATMLVDGKQKIAH